MKFSLVQIIRVLLITLFTYAGISKLLVSHVFEQQLFQSPVIPQQIVPYLTYFLPGFEILLAASLIADQFIKFSLLIAFMVMLFFSLYLIGLIIFFTKVPCACGGILGDMGYPTHIIFNMIFTFLTGYAFSKYLDEKQPNGLLTK